MSDVYQNNEMHQVNFKISALEIAEQGIVFTGDKQGGITTFKQEMSS